MDVVFLLEIAADTYVEGSPLDLFWPLGYLLLALATKHVLGQALDEVARWDGPGPAIPLAVNLSVANLLDTEFPAVVASLLEKSAVDPSNLILEVTETMVMADPRRAGDLLGQIGALGVGLSLDDFGTGHSSLNHLRRLPVHELKLDQSFVSNVLESHADAAIVDATSRLARNLGLRVVAEGVESQAILDRLAELGCEIAQGFHIGAPVIPERLPAMAQGLIRVPRAAAPVNGETRGTDLLSPASASTLARVRG